MPFLRPHRRVERLDEDRYRIDLGDAERKLLADLADQLRNLVLSGPSDSTRRLFPPAHANDPELEAEYRSLVGDSLLEKRLADLDALESSLEAKEVGEAELTAWMSAINSIRLVLGTNLDMTEDLDIEAIEEGDPRLPGLAVYQVLTVYLGEIVEALAGWDRRGLF